jgi:hypothetical protein
MVLIGHFHHLEINCIRSHPRQFVTTTQSHHTPPRIPVPNRRFFRPFLTFLPKCLTFHPSISNVAQPTRFRDFGSRSGDEQVKVNAHHSGMCSRQNNHSSHKTWRSETVIGWVRERHYVQSPRERGKKNVSPTCTDEISRYDGLPIRPSQRAMYKSIPTTTNHLQTSPMKHVHTSHSVGVYLHASEKRGVIL